MKKKLVTLLLAASMVMTTLAGCGSSTEEAGNGAASSQAANSQEAVSSEAATEVASNFNAEGYPIVNEEITLKVMLMIRDTDTMIAPEEMPTIQRLEELTGIKTEWEVIKGADFETKLNLMFASGEYPDVIIAPNANGQVDDEEYGVTQGILLPLDELIEKYMPTYVERRDMEESDPTISLVASDGQQYSVGYMVAQNINANQHWVINQDWLKALNLETPTDVESLTEVLRAFATQDPNGNGQKDEIALEMGLDPGFYGVRYLALPLFGVPCDSSKWIYLDDNKKVQFTATQDGFRECMEWMHTMYNEGIIDPEVLSQDVATIESKLKAGNVGFTSVWRLVSMGFDDGIMKDCALWTPTDENVSMHKTIELARAGAFVTSTNENVEATMRWLDALMETETQFSLYMGEQDATDGTGWKWDDNGMITQLNDGSVEVRNFLDCNTMFWAPGKYYFSTFNLPESRIEKSDWCKTYTDAGVMQKYSNDYLDLAPLTSDQIAEATLKETDINNAVQEYMANFVMNGVTDESWNKFVAIFDGMDIQSYIDMYQAAIDTMDIE